MIEIGTKFKITDQIPAAGKYKCLTCWFTVEIEQRFVDMGKTFFVCPMCHSWAEGGPRGPQDDIWEFLG